MTRIAIVGGMVMLGGVVACGGGTDSPSSVINNGGAGAGGGSAGTGFVLTGVSGGGAGGSASGGASGSGGSATTPVGGSAGTGTAGSTGTAGAPGGVPGYPSGPVSMCFGPGCPMGECDNDQFFADVTCSSLYSMDVGPSSNYCKAGATNSYCLEVGSGFGSDFSVSCAAGTATVMDCDSGCGSSFGSAYACTTF